MKRIYSISDENDIKDNLDLDVTIVSSYEHDIFLTTIQKFQNMLENYHKTSVYIPYINARQLSKIVITSYLQQIKELIRHGSTFKEVCDRINQHLIPFSRTIEYSASIKYYKKLVSKEERDLLKNEGKEYKKKLYCKLEYIPENLYYNELKSFKEDRLSRSKK